MVQFWKLANDENHEIECVQFSSIFLANINMLRPQGGRNLGLAGLLKSAHPEMSRFRFLSLVLANIHIFVVLESHFGGLMEQNR